MENQVKQQFGHAIVGHPTNKIDTFMLFYHFNIHVYNDILMAIFWYDPNHFPRLKLLEK